MPSYNGQLAKPAWWLMDGEGKIVASIRADSAIEARDAFKAEGLSGVRVKKADAAPVDETAAEPGARCEHCGNEINEKLDYRVVTGYERLHREAGGTNAIRCPDRTAERYACWECVGKLANGVSPHQTTMA